MSVGYYSICRIVFNVFYGMKISERIVVHIGSVSVEVDDPDVVSVIYQCSCTFPDDFIFAYGNNNTSLIVVKQHRNDTGFCFAGSCAAYYHGIGIYTASFL